MSHGRVIAPFFMSTVGYGIFLNTIEKDTTFFKQGGGFETQGYLDYYFMYGPDFKTILNEYAEITGRIPMHRWGQPEDLQGAVVFLASPAAAYVTGAILPVDGGYLGK